MLGFEWTRFGPCLFDGVSSDWGLIGFWVPGSSLLDSSLCKWLFFFLPTAIRNFLIIVTCEKITGSGLSLKHPLAITGASLPVSTSVCQIDLSGYCLWYSSAAIRTSSPHILSLKVWEVWRQNLIFKVGVKRALVVCFDYLCYWRVM